jgi:DNA-binding protein HU-beta
MNRVKIEAVISEKTGKSKTDVARIVDAFLREVTIALTRGDEVRLVGFGTFSVRSRPDRMGKNPKTGASIKIKASRRPAFKAGRLLVRSLNGK